MTDPSPVISRSSHLSLTKQNLFAALLLMAGAFLQSLVLCMCDPEGGLRFEQDKFLITGLLYGISFCKFLAVLRCWRESRLAAAEAVMGILFLLALITYALYT